MLARLGKIFADPDRTLIAGAGPNALVITRRIVNEEGRELSAGERAGLNSGDPTESNPLNPLEKASRHDLSAAEQEVVRELKERDRDVRQHERKHLSAAGGLALGGARYHYQIGPDGKPYAVGGEVQIDTSPVPGDPEATKSKADQIRRAALAPGDASGPDLAAARGAGTLETLASRAYRENDANQASTPTRNELRLFA